MKTTKQQMAMQGFEEKNTNGTWYFKEIKGKGKSGLTTTDQVITQCFDIHISVNCDSMKGDEIGINTPHVTFIRSIFMGAEQIHVYYDFDGENVCKYRETKSKSSGAPFEVAMNSTASKPYDIYADILMRVEANEWKTTFTPSGHAVENQNKLSANDFPSF
ncbi:MAG: hypothetical protein PHY54_04960 [Methylococcales bacterium]|nr:hypothetical protein [Methylococcales bacterium]